MKKMKMEDLNIIFKEKLKNLLILYILEGEILVKLINDGDGDVMIHKGDRFAQGIFVKHYITDNDDATGERIGGVGSTK